MGYSISVIIPVYNAERYLEEALRSVRRQSLGFAAIQIVAANDRSTDRSLQILRRWEKKYPNVTVVQTQANSGSASAPRNLALTRAEAPYVMFLDNDDRLAPRACETLLREMESGGLDIVGGDYAEIHYDRRVRRTSCYDAVPARDFDFSCELPAYRPIADPFWTNLFKMEIIRGAGLHFESDLYGEDTLFLLQYLVHCRKGRYLKQTIYEYRIREDSLFHVFDKPHFFGMLRGDEKIRACLLGAGQQQYYQDYLATHISDVMDVIANAQRLEPADIPDILAAWRPYLEEAVRWKLRGTTPFGRIVLDDAAAGDWEKAAFHMQELYEICRAKNAALGEVLSSRGWKLLSAANRLLGR